MAESAPSVTIIIPTRPDQAEIKAVNASRCLKYPAGKLEVIVARGKQPSAQRNAALKASHGEFIYFLDDDSVPQPDNIQRAMEHFRDPKVQMVGGPNICPPEAPGIEKVFARVLSCWLAFGPSRARYASVGKTRPSSEKELILCNLLARRNPVVRLGGFDESLYPNEENALMDQLQKEGGTLIYDPKLIVERRPRPHLRAFAKMVMTYGRGRAEQFRAHPTLGSALNFVPPLFCAYLVFILVLGILRSPWWQAACYPLALYGIALVGQVLWLAFKGPVLPSIAALPLIVLTHILYGLGFWRGLLTKLRRAGDRPAPPVALETIG